MLGALSPRLNSNFFVNTNGTIVMFPAQGLGSVGSGLGATLQINGFRNQRNLVLQAVASSGNLLSCRSTSGEVLYITSNGAVVAQSSVQVYGGLYSYNLFYAGTTAQFQGAIYQNSSLHGHFTLVTDDYSVTASDEYIIVDATNANAQCIGTPSAECSSHEDQSACEANDSHGGCSWSAGEDCSVFNGDQGTCEGNGCSYPGNLGDCSVYNGNEFDCTNTSGCAWDSADCSAFNGNETDCTNNGCTWDTADCSDFNYNYGSCTSTTGCSYEAGEDCGAYFDEGSCTAISGCYWDGGTCYSNCTGTYYTGTCSGTYYPGTCSGGYDDGSCTGTYGGGCSGTPTCAGIDDSTSCGAESGCSWTTGITVDLPTGPTDGRTLWIKKIDSSGNAVNIVPYLAGGHTIELTSSLSLSAQHRATMIGYYTRPIDCSAFHGTDQSTCETGHSGCTWSDNSCSSNMDQSSCESAGCYWNDPSCEGACTGTYYIYNWYELSARRGV